jgi:hypothetical protein
MTQGQRIMQLKLNSFYWSTVAAPDETNPALYPAAEPNWLEGIITMGAVGLGVLIVAGIAVLMGMI